MIWISHVSAGQKEFRVTQEQQGYNSIHFNIKECMTQADVPNDPSLTSVCNQAIVVALR